MVYIKNEVKKSDKHVEGQCLTVGTGLEIQLNRDSG